MYSQVFNQDCIAGMGEHLQPETIDLCVTSIPFGSLFMYSGKTEDIGNNKDGIDLEASQFGLHMRFFIEQLFRVMKSGCNVCIHIQQLLTTKVQHGYMGRRDFRGAVVEQFSRGGFEWKGEFVIPKNPQAAAQRLKLHSLLFITGKKNARDLAPFMNDYVMIFQKPGTCVPVPAIRDHRLNPKGWLTTEEWIRDASGVWKDIRETDVLEGCKGVKEEGDEKHVCPLQLEVIRRLVRLYSNPGELVMDPFMGIGSTGYVAVEQGRRSVGFELKESYWRQAQRNIEKALTSTDSGQLEMFCVGAQELVEPGENEDADTDVESKTDVSPDTSADAFSSLSITTAQGENGDHVLTLGKFKVKDKTLRQGLMKLLVKMEIVEDVTCVDFALAILHGYPPSPNTAMVMCILEGKEAAEVKA